LTRDLRLELAGQRVRIAELEAIVAEQVARIDRLVEVFGSTAAARAMREEARRERAIDRRHSAIIALASLLGAGCIETLAARMELVFAGQRPVPEGADRAVADLRQEYGRSGPSRPTIRRAFSKLSNECENAPDAENSAINPPHTTERTSTTWAPRSRPTTKPESAKSSLPATC
jgi:hypothetical protein